MVNWEGPDDSNDWKEALTRAVTARVAREQREMPGWEPAHSLDPEWLSAHGHTWWQERSALTGGSSYLKNLDYANIDFRRVAVEGRPG